MSIAATTGCTYSMKRRRYAGRRARRRRCEKRPCRFTAEYTPYDGALIFRDICSETARQEIIRTVQAVCREHGKEPDVYLKEETDE